jgi:tRNA/rRNA methyltransferase
MTEAVDLGRFAVVLKQPRYPENIGSAARAMRNMGIHRLVVVDPQQCDLTRVLKLATHAAFDVVENMTVCESLGEALAPFSYVVGTTARLGGQRALVHTPGRMAARLVSLARENDVALVFGPEDRGLTNEDIRLCHELINIPTADFASLNLAQAVMIVCYEVYQASRREGTDFSPRLASRHELDGMYAQVRDLLIRINYVNPENPDYWMNKLRHFFTRMQLRAKEVSIIRGICRQVDWYAGKRYRDGREERKTEE